MSSPGMFCSVHGAGHHQGRGVRVFAALMRPFLIQIGLVLIRPFWLTVGEEWGSAGSRVSRAIAI